VRLESGSCRLLPDAVRFCFDVCAKDTVVEGALLEIIETPGRQSVVTATAKWR
jgi:hydrogenase nickel incorporation protein HypA/HybF